MLKFTIKKPIIPSGTDHNTLLNKGIRTHEELDSIYSEVEEAREGESSLLQKLRKIFSSIITDHTKLDNVGLKTHTELDAVAEEVETAKGAYPTLGERLDDLKPAMKLSELQDVNITDIKDGNILIWNEPLRIFRPGIMSSGGGGGGDTTELSQKVDMLIGYITSLEKNHIKMQFKYDIALNLVKNYCSDYFIDVLQDNSNIEILEDVTYNPITESIY